MVALDGVDGPAVLARPATGYDRATGVETLLGELQRRRTNRAVSRLEEVLDDLAGL